MDRHQALTRQQSGHIWQVVTINSVAELAELAALDAPAHQFDELADLLIRAALLLAGYRQHKRGEWRKTRAGCRENPAP